MSTMSTNRPVRLLFHGGDNMLGRAAQLTFPVQAPGDEDIRDSCTASHYLQLCLQHPSGHDGKDLDVEEIRRRNAQQGSYLWGEYLTLQIRPPPNLRVLNLETAVTKSIHNADIPARKGINYHMHVDNLAPIMTGFCQTTHSCTTTTAADVKQPSPVLVSLANNHIMDFGRIAMEEETLPAFSGLNSMFSYVGCGRNLIEAQKPAVISTPKVEVEIFAVATQCSGTPSDWWATLTRSGLVGLTSIINSEAVDHSIGIVKDAIQAGTSSDATHDYFQRCRLRILSIHWGPNWAGKGESSKQVEARRELAHRLVDECNVDIIYGHSSHHIRGMEVYKNKLIMYGTGDMINDYEGFENAGEEAYNRLGGIFVVDVDGSSGDLEQLRIVPMFMNRLRVERYTRDSKLWNPSSRSLHADPNKSEHLCHFLNRMSKVDGGSGALHLEHADEDSNIPGGPVLKTRSFSTK